MSTTDDSSTAFNHALGWRAGLGIASGATASVGLLLLIGFFHSASGGAPQSGALQLWLEGLLAVVALGTAAWSFLRHERLYGRPLRRLQAILPQVRAGQLPLQELQSVEGKLAPLAGQIYDLVHELKEQRAAAAKLEAELPQRLANRTHALERTIGSLRQQAVRDPLTTLYNRRMLDKHLPVAVAQARKNGSSLAILMIDVDHFKNLNDTLGHAAGDELLKNLGQIIRSTVRDQDAAFRCGGDEFVIVLDSAVPGAPQALAQRLISLTDALASTLRLSPPPRLSIGIAQMHPPDCVTPEDLLKAADKDLYAMKGARRRKA